MFVFLFPHPALRAADRGLQRPIYGHPASWALLAGMIGYGAANTAFAGLAITLVTRREIGILKRIRATPLPPAAYLTAVLMSIMIVFALQVVSLFVARPLLKSTPWPHHLFSLVLALALGAAAFAALGLAITGFIRSLEGSSAVLNVIVLPTAFSQRLIRRDPALPAGLRAIGDVLPLKYLLDLINANYLHGQEIWDKPDGRRRTGAWGAVRDGCCSAHFPLGAA